MKELNRMALINEITRMHPQRIEMLLKDINAGFIDVSMECERKIVELSLRLALEIVKERQEFIERIIKRFTYSDTDIIKFQNFLHLPNAPYGIIPKYSMTSSTVDENFESFIEKRINEVMK